MSLQDELLHMSKGGCFAFASNHTDEEVYNLFVDLYGIRPKGMNILDIVESCYDFFT